MDRHEWLKCQSWLLPCSGGEPIDVDWCFEGLASFYISPQQQVEPLSENAAHLFFSAEAPSLDPAQLALKLGVAHSGIAMMGSDVVLSFDDGNCYRLHFKQVVSISNWEQEQQCQACEKLSYLAADARKEDACACQLLPPYVVVQMKHVGMIVYPRNWSTETGLHQILSATDVLCTTFEEKKMSNCHVATQKDARKIEAVFGGPEETANLRDIHSLSKQTLQQFRSKLQCISECALAATDCCNADVPGMSRLLNVMMQRVVADRECSLQSKPLQGQLRSISVSLENEEQRHISSIWGANAQQQEAKAGAVIALQRNMEKRIQIEEALLWLELVNNSTVMD